MDRFSKADLQKFKEIPYVKGKKENILKYYLIA